MKESRKIATVAGVSFGLALLSFAVWWAWQSYGELFPIWLIIAVEIGVLAAIVAGCFLGLTQIKGIQNWLRHKTLPLVFQCGASEYAENLLGQKDGSTLISDQCLLDTYNELVTTAIAVTADTRTAKLKGTEGREKEDADMDDADVMVEQSVKGYPIVKLFGPGGYTWIEDARALWSSMRNDWSDAVTKLTGGADYALKIVLDGFGISTIAAPAALGMTDYPVAKVNVHIAVATPEYDASVKRDGAPLPEQGEADNQDLNDKGANLEREYQALSDGQP